MNINILNRAFAHTHTHQSKHISTTHIFSDLIDCRVGLDVFVVVEFVLFERSAAVYSHCYTFLWLSMDTGTSALNPKSDVWYCMWH